MRPILLAAMLSAATPAIADIEQMEAQGSVEDAFARLENAVQSAGATIFATVDHGAGAAGAGLELAPSRLLVFGNPQLGTPVMQEDPLAGLYLPLKMLVYREGEQTYVAYEEVDETFDDLDVDDDLEVLEKMEGALETFAKAAAGEG